MRISKIYTVGALAALGVSLGAVPKAEAAYIVTMEQVGSNVVATGSGSIDLTSLSFVGSTSYILPFSTHQSRPSQLDQRHRRLLMNTVGPSAPAPSGRADIRPPAAAVVRWSQIPLVVPLLSCRLAMSLARR